jgi:hypothetical protein
MRRILAILLCALLIGIMPIVASAEETITEDVPVTEETTTETEAPVKETVPEKTFTESIVEWVKANLGYISVIATSILIAFYDRITRGKLNKTLGTVNNNSIAIANNSEGVIRTALARIEKIAEDNEQFRADMNSLLSEIRKSAEEKQSLEVIIAHVETFLKSAKLATLELSNEVAELLVLANIPVAKKDELYARHTKAVHELEAVEEVMSDERKEA